MTMTIEETLEAEIEAAEDRLAAHLQTRTEPREAHAEKAWVDREVQLRADLDELRPQPLCTLTFKVR